MMSREAFEKWWDDNRKMVGWETPSKDRAWQAWKEQQKKVDELEKKLKNYCGDCVWLNKGAGE